MKDLKLALIINAGFSTLTGLMLILGNGFFADFFGLEQKAPFWILGIGLLLFAGLVYVESKRKILNLKQAKIISIADILWVLGSIGIVSFDPFSISFEGKLVIVLVSLCVGFFAFHQLYAARFYANKQEGKLHTAV